MCRRIRRNVDEPLVTASLKTQIQALFLLLALGVIWGSGYSIAHYATTHGVPPLGYAFWQSLGPAIFMLLLTKFRGTTWRRQTSNLRFYFITGLLGIALPNTNMYFAAAHLPAGVLAVIVNTVPVMTYLIAWAVRSERFSWWRISGVLICSAGIMLLVIPEGSLPSAKMIPWVLDALVSPFCFALCAVYSTKFCPNEHSLTLSAGMLAASSLILTPVILATHQFYPLWAPFHLRDWVIILEIILSSVGYVIFFRLLNLAGAVYYSLVGGVVALTGLAWGAFLFDERLTALAAAAVSLIILGILIVSSRFRFTHE